MTVEKIAYNIKLFRETAGWTQEKLAEKVVTSRSNIAKWENSSTIPDVQSLIKLSDVFNVSIDHLIGKQTFQNELLRDFKRIYGSNTKDFDEEIVEIVEYTMTFPMFKEQIYRLQTLPIKSQQSIHKLLSDLINQFEKL